MNKFTTNDDRSIEMMLIDYEQQNKDVGKINFRNLEDKDKELLSEYEDTKEFLAEVRKALDFTKSSTITVLNSNISEGLSLKCASIMKDEKEYAKTMVTLTGGFDKTFIKAQEETRTKQVNPEIMGINEYNATIKAPLSDDAVSKVLKQEFGDLDTCEVMKQKDVSDLVKAIDLTKGYREKYGIEDESIIAGTLQTFFEENKANRTNTISITPLALFNKEVQKEQIPTQQIAEMHDAGYRSDDVEKIERDFTLTATQLTATVILLNKFEKLGVNVEAKEQAVKELEEKNIPVEIVESNDGFVMNMDALIPENAKAIRDKVENGNEVIHNEAPQETTIDPAMAKGKVKLEEARDIGSKETQQIEAGADLGFLNEKYDEEQTDEDKKTKKQKISFDR